jgi:hypothetical protein
MTTRKGGRIMKKKEAKNRKAKAALKGGLKDLPAKSKRAAAVKGGQKAFSPANFKLTIGD